MFKKGISGFTGKKHSKEWKEAISKAMKGRKLTREHVLRSAIARTGKKRTPEQLARIGAGSKGKGIGNQNAKGHISWNKGKPAYEMTDEVRQKMSKSRMGDKHWNWKGGITPENMRIRHSQDYILWRTAVFMRDNYTCVLCGDDRGGNLEADHIKPFASFPELRFAIDNGRTLCRPCHQAQPTNGRRKVQITRFRG